MKAALIGLGMVSRTFADAFANTKAAELAVVYAPSAARREKFLADWPGPAEARNLEDIANSDVDFVVVATPPNARADIVETMIKARKPILMEKPIERTLSAAIEIVEKCEAARLPLGIMLQLRTRPILSELRAVLPEFGGLRAVETNVPWWRPQSYYDEAGRGSYARDGGGVLISQAIHTLDLMLTLTGPVTEVTAMTSTTQFHKMEGEDFVTAGLRFENGAVGQLFAATASFPGTGETIRLHYENASVLLKAGTLDITYQDGRSKTLGQSAGSGAGADPMAFTSDWHRFVIEDFVEALTEHRPPLITGRSALGVHRLIAAIERSGAEHRRVHLSELD